MLRTITKSEMNQYNTCVLTEADKEIKKIDKKIKKIKKKFDKQIKKKIKEIKDRENTERLARAERVMVCRRSIIPQAQEM